MKTGEHRLLDVISLPNLRGNLWGNLRGNVVSFLPSCGIYRRLRRRRRRRRLFVASTPDVRLPVRELVLQSPVRRVLAEGPEAAAAAVDDHDDDQAVHRAARGEVPACRDAVDEEPQP